MTLLEHQTICSKPRNEKPAQKKENEENRDLVGENDNNNDKGLMTVAYCRTKAADVVQVKTI